MTDERDTTRDTRDESTGRWPWTRNREQREERDAVQRSRAELAERFSQREEEAEAMRREVGAIPKCEPDPYCVPMNLRPDDERCQPRPVQQQRRGSHIVGGYGRNR